MVAIVTLVGEDPAVDQIGCGEVRDMYSGLKNARDERLEASLRSFCSQ